MTALLLDSRDDDTTDDEPRDVDVAGEDAPEHVIRCRACRSVVTRPRHKITVNGRHDHVFTNPHGYLFHIAGFAEAEGAVGAGHESNEWTWFAGYDWRSAVCRGCHTHIGWTFRQVDHGFFGLIICRLLE